METLAPEQSIINQRDSSQLEIVSKTSKPPLEYGFRIGYDFDEDDSDTIKAAKIAEKKTILWVQWSGETKTSNWGFNVEVDGDGNVYFSGKASGAAPHNITLVIRGTWKDSRISLKSMYSDNTVLKYEGYYKREGNKVKFEMERTIVQIGHKTTTNFNWKKGKIGKCGGEFLSDSWLKNDCPLPSIPLEPTISLIFGQDSDVNLMCMPVESPKKLDLSSDFSFATYIRTSISDEFQIIFGNWPLFSEEECKFLFALTPIAGSYQFAVIFQINGKIIINLKAGNIKQSQWSHLAFTWNKAKKEGLLYVDGMMLKRVIVKDDLIPVKDLEWTQFFEIGYNADDNGALGFSGNMRHFTIYNECINAFFPQDLYKKQFVRRATAKFNRVEADLPDKKDWHENFYVPYEVGDQFNVTADDYEHWYDALRCSDDFKCLIQKNMFDVEVLNTFDEKVQDGLTPYLADDGDLF